MCGIAGILNFSGYDPKQTEVLFDRALRSLLHRGPDAFGISCSGALMLGHTRLAIIDLNERANQPMRSASGNIEIVFNGEAYNFTELRDKFLPEATLQTTSDTEVLVEAWSKKGFNLLSEINGMFALAVADYKKNILTLARDRFGQKPLYYGSINGVFVFASELKFFKHYFGKSRLRLSKLGLARYLTFGYVAGTETIYNGIYKLQPGHFLKVDLKTGNFDLPVAYWDPKDYIEDNGADDYGGDDGLENLLEQAVKRRLIADVPVGALLSGGMDSSLVVALAAKQYAQKLKTFHIYFQEEAYSERRFARSVAECCGTDHVEILVKPVLPDAFEKLISVFDEPFADSSTLLCDIIFNEVSKHLKVVLTGDGGDELFFGYTRYARFQNSFVFDRLPICLLQPLFLAGAKIFQDGRLKERLTKAGFGAKKRYVGMNSFYLEDKLRSLLGVNFSSEIFLPFLNPMQVNYVDVLRNVQLTDILNYLPNDILTKVDRTSMSYSLEVRSPFMDYQLAQWALSMPSTANLREGQGKHLLHKLCMKLFPNDLFKMYRKQGFAVPLKEWFQNDLKEMVMELLLGRNSKTGYLLNPTIIKKLYMEHVKGEIDRSPQLFQLIMLEFWLRENY